jgi:photosystem II stability/assembly factor-like uncharacterized protein
MIFAKRGSIVALSLLLSLHLSACGGSATIPKQPQPTVEIITPVFTVTPFPTIVKPTKLPELPTEQGGSITQIIDISFVDAQTIWVLAAACTEGDCPITMRVTYDGGTNWQKSIAPPTKANSFPYDSLGSADLSGVGLIRFATRSDGWIFGPSLFSTHNGGQTWTDEKRLIFSMELTDGVIWAIEQENGAPTILRSIDGGKTWPQVEQQPKLSGWQALVGVDRNTAWLYTQNIETFEPKAFITRNGGNSWQELSPPASFGSPVYAGAVSPDHHLWFVCGSGPATIMQIKQIYVSSDDGSSWELRADAWKPNVDGNIPMVGHFLGEKFFAAVSASTAFIALNRNTLYMTTDGGQQWRVAIPYEQANGGGDPAIGPVRFVDEKHGCMAAGPNRLFCTNDGGLTWGVSVIP